MCICMCSIYILSLSDRVCWGNDKMFTKSCLITNGFALLSCLQGFVFHVCLFLLFVAFCVC